MRGIRAVRVTTAGARKAAVRVEYDDGSAQVILADQLLMPPPLEPAAARIQVANRLKKLTVAPQGIEPNQIIIEWTPAKA
jgi:FtsP/CotA-like multicopper oxidase with cupredoxin domain